MTNDVCVQGGRSSPAVEPTMAEVGRRARKAIEEALDGLVPGQCRSVLAAVTRDMLTRDSSDAFSGLEEAALMPEYRVGTEDEHVAAVFTNALVCEAMFHGESVDAALLRRTRRSMGF